MSGLRTVKTFEVVKIELDEIKEKDLVEIEEKVCNILMQKLEKLNILIKDMNVYCHNGCLLINDRYKICSDLEEIALAFGLKIKKISCSLRGNTFIVSDELVTLLKQIGIDYAFGTSVVNQDITEEIKSVIESNAWGVTLDNALLEIVANIRKNGSFEMTKTREINSDYYDGRLVRQTKGAWDSDEKKVQAQISALAKRCNQAVSKSNADMVQGTAKLIYSRARQMGYSVEKVKKGNSVQLVLVRLQ